ncbi:hypothetical protein ACFQFQ_25050 [Sulfitobacter porphyrae]|uniref:Uncharacterized protein n=1 Tax=Sulfitobacter porphyrae TaxID=1246864 RepID=A0ABW2B961_9RHOB
MAARAQRQCDLLQKMCDPGLAAQHGGGAARDHHPIKGQNVIGENTILHMEGTDRPIRANALNQSPKFLTIPGMALREIAFVGVGHQNGKVH